jgi:hypothetical protein
MTDGVELIPVNDQDVEEAVFRAWEEGKGPHALSREFALSIRRVEEIIDRTLPVFDAQNQLRAYKRELRRLEDLSGEFFAIAKRDKNHESGHLYARLNERICAMRGIGPMNMRMDPLQVEVAQQPSRHDRIVEAFKRLQDSAPPAVKALRERLDEMSAEQALELLGPPQPKGNGAAPSDDPDPK